MRTLNPQGLVPRLVLSPNWWQDLFNRWMGEHHQDSEFPSLGLSRHGDGPLQLQVKGERALYCGHTEREICETVRQHHPYPEADLQAWMDAYAFRMKNWDGSRIRTTSPQEFVEDMKRSGQFRTWSDHLGGEGWQ